MLDPEALHSLPGVSTLEVDRSDTEVSEATQERLTVNLPPELIERARNAVYWTPGLTLAGLAREALVKSLVRLEKENGGPFKERDGELRAGRPVQ